VGAADFGAAYDRYVRGTGTLKGTEVQTKLQAKDKAMMGALRVEQQLLREWLKSLDKSSQDLEQMTPAKK
jgi:hypothetical protein